MPESISACLIVQNEAERLPDALASVAFCDEIVVVDGGSTDGTAAIAERAGARVVHNPWPGFGAQRNRAIDEATSDWVLELDADERVSPALRGEIERFLAAPATGIDLVAIPIRHRFLGRQLGASARYPAYRYRLFKRDAFRHDEQRTVHEGLWSSDAVPRCFENDLEHVLADSVREAIADTWRYARLEAEQSSVTGARAAVKELLVRPVAKVAYRTIVLEGWRDGVPGLTKIGLDAATDMLVAGHSVAGRGNRNGAPPRSVTPRSGPARIVALAPAALAGAAAAWLARAAALGADVVLVTDGELDTTFRTRRLPKLGYRSVVRAVDSENQLRPLDALLLADGRGARWVRRMPRAMRGAIPPVTLEDAPAAVVETILALRPGDAVRSHS